MTLKIKMGGKLVREFTMPACETIGTLYEHVLGLDQDHVLVYDRTVLDETQQGRLCDIMGSGVSCARTVKIVSKTQEVEDVYDLEPPELLRSRSFAMMKLGTLML